MRQLQIKYHCSYLFFKGKLLKKTKKKKNVTSHKEISKELYDFNRNLYTEKFNVYKDKISQFLNIISIPQLTS